MKLTFHIRSKSSNINETRSIDFPYEGSGHICSLILCGSLDRFEPVLVPNKSTSFPTGCYLYNLDLSWSRFEGFRFNQYLDESISSSLQLNYGFLRGYTQIQLANSLINITFRAEFNYEDLGNCDERLFLEVSSRYGIAIKNIQFSNVFCLDGLSFWGNQLIDIKFSSCSLKGVNFSGCKLTNVSFDSSLLDGSNFNKSVFTNVEFINSSMVNCDFEECQVKYSARRILDEAVLKVRACNLRAANFRRSEICIVADSSNLSEIDFSLSELVACRFYDCIIENVNFASSKFTSSAQGIKLNEKYPDFEKLICKFGSRNSPSNTSRGAERLSFLNNNKAEIVSSCFTSASIVGADFSYNTIKDCVFEDADLKNAKFHHCIIEHCEFQRVTLSPAKCSFANFSFSMFFKNNFNEADFYRATMISINDQESDFSASKLNKANLRGSKLLKTIFVGVFFGDADLTSTSFDFCKLNGANFYQTQRSGIELNIEDEHGKKISTVADLQDHKSNNKSIPKLKSTCEIGNVQWYSTSNGEIIIDENTFLHIIIGSKSPIGVLANLTKENPNIINIMNQNQASADARSAGHDQVNADTNVDSVNNGSVQGPDIKIGSDIGNNEIENDESLNAKNEHVVPNDIISNEVENDLEDSN